MPCNLLVYSANLSSRFCLNIPTTPTSFTGTLLPSIRTRAPRQLPTFDYDNYDPVITGMNTMRFRLAISAEDYLSYYEGVAKQVIVRAEDGRRLRFPASAIRKFVTREGVNGLFEISFDASNKLIGIERLEG